MPIKTFKRFVAKKLDNYRHNDRKLLKSDLAFLFMVKVISVLTFKKFNINRFIFANRSLNEFPFEVHSNLPEIEICIPIAKKDFELVVDTVDFALKSSANPVSKVSLICPKYEMFLLESEITKSNLNSIKVEIISEVDLIPSMIYEKIEPTFGNRAGWVTAEFVKFYFLVKNKSAGVLVLDADTFLINSKIWLNKEKQQVLMPVEEYHPPYFRFLKKTSSLFGECSCSFMSHHMLMQPWLVRELFEKVWKTSDLDLWNSIISNVDFNEYSNLCICYEAYGNFLINNHTELAMIEKWSNKVISRKDILDVAKYIQMQKFNSISLHSYL